ncbi:MAG: 16S rRNA (cytosine(1402)-N(4))-methyltransferase RsmH [Pseudomonadota bacterium]
MHTHASDPMQHIPVMLDEALEYLNVEKDGWYLDATFGAGGYSQAILKQGGHVLACDRDPDAFERAQIFKKKMAGVFPDQHFVFACVSFSQTPDIREVAAQYDIEKFNAIVMDLGLSSPQLEKAERGFSITRNGHLDMRMDRRQKLDAYQLVNFKSEAELADIFYYFGEEKKSRRIAHAIVKQRAIKAIETTHQLSEIIVSTIGYPRKTGTHYARIHPATKVFQALRIYVNNELDELDQALDRMPTLLKREGRLVVVSFHSLEDRIVKKKMRESTLTSASRYSLDALKQESKDKIAPDCLIQPVVRKILRASDFEVACNHRARSARMLVGERI